MNRRVSIVLILRTKCACVCLPANVRAHAILNLSCVQLRHKAIQNYMSEHTRQMYIKFVNIFYPSMQLDKAVVLSLCS
jgi:hypothetical protein